MPRRKRVGHAPYSVDTSFDIDNPTGLRISLARLRERVMRTSQITLEADQESNDAYLDFLTGLGSTGTQSYQIDGSVAAYYENDAMETSYYNDFLYGLDGNEVDESTVPQENLQYYDNFEDSVDGDATQYTTSPEALEVYEDFEEGIT
jgi:hypothetical protein